MGPFKTSYNRDLDVIKSWYLIIIAAFFAVLFHSNLNRSVWADFGWAFSQYLETIAILSQFILFNKKVIKILISGRINRNILITFYRSPGYFENFVFDFLGLHLHRIKRVQQKQSIQFIAWICGLLVHGNPSYPSFYHGWFYVLLGQSGEKGRRSPASHLYLILNSLYTFLLLLIALSSKCQNNN